MNSEPRISRTVSRPNRRSFRIPFTTRIVINGNDPQSAPFRADGEILEVSMHGARIRTAANLSVGMRLRIFSPAKRQSCDATVVWSHASAGTEAGVRLDRPGNFWGLQFPSDRRANSNQTKDMPVDGLPVPQANGDVGTPVSISDRPPAGEPLQIPAEGAQVIVNGISLCQAPFQERTTFLPDQNVDTEAMLWLKPMLKPGANLRIVFADGRMATAKVERILENATGERRIVRVMLKNGLRLVRV